MAGPPSCTAADFELPQLRRCPFAMESLKWEARLGGGLDGYVWKVHFGDQGPFALKVFWDSEAPEFVHYYAPQRECQNAALLQMMETAVEKATAASRPILLKANPRTWEVALANQAAFSDEARANQPQLADQDAAQDAEFRQITAMPRVKKCHGWLTVNSDDLFRSLLGRLAPTNVETDWKYKRFFQSGTEYIAIVYEYVEEGKNDAETMQAAMDFFWRAGFSRTPTLLVRNWKSGALVDLADIAPPRGYHWDRHYYAEGPYSAVRLLQQEEAEKNVFTGLRHRRMS